MKRMLIWGAFALGLSACGPTSPSAAQQGNAGAPHPTAPAPALVSPLSAAFAQKVANSNAFEIEASTVALQQATQPAVREFGRAVAAERQASAQALARVIPTAQLAAVQLDARQEMHLNTLRSAPSDQFDRAFLDSNIAEHRDIVRTFQEFVSAAPETPLRQWAQRTLPLLEQRLERAEALKQST